MYCLSTWKTQRFKTREVVIGKVKIGSCHPLAIQSMTTSDTKDIITTVEQIKKLADEGCDIARVTVQGKKEAAACENIKNRLLSQNYTIPLVADIHFYPPAALCVADFVDKIRINPGNYADKRATFKQVDYDEHSYEEALNKIEEKFVPLVLKCKQQHKAIRIGTNHGSLSDRIMNYFGDTPKGMVESAFEYARICRKYDFHQLVFSMKSSNPVVMVQAYRLLVSEMLKQGWDYPIHLGVTEAGFDLEGRIKSSMGIGSLLMDGIGDTLRVSLTEDPWFEIDSCQRIRDYASIYYHQEGSFFEEKGRNYLEYAPRHVSAKHLGLHDKSSVFLFQKTVKRPVFNPSEESPEAIMYPICTLANQETMNIEFLSQDLTFKQKLSTLREIKAKALVSQFSLSNNTSSKSWLWVKEDEDWSSIIQLKPSILFFAPKENLALHATRKFYSFLHQHQLEIPVILCFSYTCTTEDLPIRAASEYGALLCDGIGDGIAIIGDYPTNLLKEISFIILQASRIRVSKTEYISCPSCGRTLFDLQEVTRGIKSRTQHLSGVKIAVMGCIVNGPGEMADADFGYVGSKAKKIDLYVGKECVEKNIDFSEAEDRLVALIKSQGKWKDPVDDLSESLVTV